MLSSMPAAAAFSCFWPINSAGGKCCLRRSYGASGHFATVPATPFPRSLPGTATRAGNLKNIGVPVKLSATSGGIGGRGWGSTAGRFAGAWVHGRGGGGAGCGGGGFHILTWTEAIATLWLGKEYGVQFDTRCWRPCSAQPRRQLLSGPFCWRHITCRSKHRRQIPHTGRLGAGLFC